MKAPVNLALLPIIEQAAAEGFTHVLTMAGPVPLEQFHYRDTLGYSYADGAPRRWRLKPIRGRR